MDDNIQKDKVPHASFWESSFIEKQTMWGFDPSVSALAAKDFFLEEGVRDILIPGIGYGRNAAIFIANGIGVTGIEISATAIDLARKHYGTAMEIYHGPVTDMPFDDMQYDGIFCHALIHLLDRAEREQLLQDCFNQLSPDGCMLFSAISKEAPTYGKGKRISEDQYEVIEGAHLYFYDRDSIQSEFGKFGLFEILDIDEQPVKKANQDSFPFFLIKCRRSA